MVPADCESYVSLTRRRFQSILVEFPMSSTSLNVAFDTDVNTDGHQTSKKAHAPNRPDPLRQLFARPWNSSSRDRATVIDAEQDRLP
jgi:hypothetical protein